MKTVLNYTGPYQDIIHLHRPLSSRIGMPVSHRAKQFAPFAALKGFETCIQEKEEKNNRYSGS